MKINAENGLFEQSSTGVRQGGQNGVRVNHFDWGKTLLIHENGLPWCMLKFLKGVTQIYK